MSLSPAALELRDRLNAVICPICTERRADGTCGLERIDECPLTTHLDGLVCAAVTVKSARMDPYVDALREEICPSCRHRVGPVDRCAIRAEGHCALDAFLMPALDVVDDFIVELEDRARTREHAGT